MTERLRSPHPGFDKMTPVYNGGPPPPPWPSLGDPRTDDCRHDWNTGWGRKGERQHRCESCGRWIWQRAIWPTERDSSPSRDSDRDGSKTVVFGSTPPSSPAPVSDPETGGAE